MSHRSDDWSPPARGACTCTIHLDDLRHVVIESTESFIEPMTVEELLATDDLKADPLLPATRRRTGPDFHWSLWVGDTARAFYDDHAPLRLDEGLLASPGVKRVEWYEREEFIVGAPTLCVDGMTAVVARVLADPRVRLNKSA